MSEAVVPAADETAAPAGERLRQQLGLTCDPFAETSLPAFYFVGGQRRYLVQQAVHQLYFGAPIVLLVGAWGAGKSRLLTEVRRELAGLADLCLTAATIMTDAAALRREIAAAAGLPPGAAHSTETLLASLERSRPQQAQPQPILLLLDDAHLLAPAELAASLELVQLAEGRIRALLAAEVSLFASWPPQLRAAEGLVARLDLDPLDPQESVDYLRTRLQAAGLRAPLPLDAAGERQLFKDSRGNLAAIHETGSRLLLAALTPAARQPGARRGRLALPGWSALAANRRWAVVVVGVALLAGALLWLGGEETPARGDEALETVVADAGRRRVPLVLDWEQPDAAPAPQPAGDRIATGGTTEAAPTAVAPEPAAPPASMEVPTAEPSLTPAPAAATAPATSTPPAAAPVAPPAAAPAPAPPQSAPAASSAPTAANRSLSPDEQALLALPAGQQVMVQLMGARALADLRRSIQASGFTGQVYYVESRMGGKPWYVALTGPVAKPEAQRAIAALPASLRAAKPWPRPLSGIQDEVRARRR